jgi:hydroxypyruvate reductase
MTAGLIQALNRSKEKLPSIAGWINVPEGSLPNECNIPSCITVCQARPQGSNEPTETVVAGTREILNLVRNAGPTDCVIALISGGGSALLCSPIDGISLQEKVELTRALSANGANIEQLNSVRRCLSNIKGGGLARACHAKQLITCILSDVLGDPLEVIASGPTILEPEPNPAQAISLLNHVLPGQFANVLAILNDSLRHRSMPSSQVVSSRTERSTFVLANNATAVDAAGQKAVELGYRYWMKSERVSDADAEQLGKKIANQLAAMFQPTQIDCFISGGEPTVTLPPPEKRGLGGRNQQLSLSVLNELHRMGGWPKDVELVFLSGGTDGEDGPTDAAGAYLDRDVYERMMQLSLDPSDFLERCDAYRFFEQTGGLLKTGPTNTNVCDLRVALVRPSKALRS